MNPAPLAFSVHDRLAGRLESMAAERVLVIDYVASWRCGAVSGDVRARWRTRPPGGSFEAIEPIEGVAVYVDRRLRDVLRAGGPELWPGGVLRGGTPSVRLREPERWLDFLEGPTSMARPAR